MFRVSTSRRCALDGGTQKAPPVSTAHLLVTTAFKGLAADHRGNVGLPFAFMLTAMCMLTGAAVDIGMWMQARMETEEAIDAAVLAGLQNYQHTSNATTAVQAAQAAYKANITDRLAVATDTINFQLINNNTEMQATGDATYATKFLTLANVNTLPLLKTDGSENAIAQASVGSNSGQSLEVAIMIDNTGSMCESAATANTGQCASPSKISVVQAAANSLVDQVVWADQSTYTSRVAIIPFDQAVNISSAASITAARGTVSGADPNCVSERLGVHRYDDVSPATAPVGYLATASNNGNGNGYGYGYGRQQPGNCPLAMISLTNNKTALHTLINNMAPGSSTAGHIGTAWAWYALSPNFNGIWTSASSAARPYSDLTTLNAHGQPILKKIAILMTDGAYNTQYCNGFPDFNTVENKSTCPSGNYNDNSFTQATALCTNMKATGIEVYTIGAMVTPDAQAFLTSCATDSNHYFNATSTASLQAAFASITQKLIALHLVH